MPVPATRRHPLAPAPTTPLPPPGCARPRHPLGRAPASRAQAKTLALDACPWLAPVALRADHGPGCKMPGAKHRGRDGLSASATATARRRERDGDALGECGSERLFDQIHEECGARRGVIPFYRGGVVAGRDDIEETDGDTRQGDGVIRNGNVTHTAGLR